MKSVLSPTAEAWGLISFWSLLLTGALYFLTESLWVAVFALGCGLVYYVIENLLLFTDLKRNEGIVADLRNDLTTCMRTMQTMRERNELLEQRLWRIESTYLSKSQHSGGRRIIIRAASESSLSV
jgi:hypothetical protein